MSALRLLLAAWLWAALLPGWSQDVLPVPALTARVIDQTGTLNASQRAALEAKLAAFEQAGGTQIVVLLVPTTLPEDIAAYAQRVADSWKIGRRDVGDGLLLVVAKNDRRVRIEVAKTLEGAIPDLAARQVIDRAITPAFRAGNFAGGIDAALDLLFARIKGENLPPPKPQAPLGQHGDDAIPWGALALFFFLAVPVAGRILSAMLGRRLGSLVTAGGTGAAAWLLTASLLVGGIAALLALFIVGVFGGGGFGGGPGGGLSRGTRYRHGGPVIWGGGGGFGGGGFGGGFGGGGFGSGGGGDFGGGGASGSW